MMSLYCHVANKESLRDGVVETLIDEVQNEVGGVVVEPDAADWVPVMRTLVPAARRLMLRHQWALALIETRAIMTAALLRYFDSMLGVAWTRAGGRLRPDG